MSFAPVANPPRLTEAQQTAANTIAQLPAMVRLQGMLDGAVRAMDAKLNAARNAGREPPYALVQLVTDARTRANTLRSQLASIHDSIRNATRDAVFRGWLTYQQAVDAGVFRAPPELSGIEGAGVGSWLTPAIRQIIRNTLPPIPRPRPLIPANVAGLGIAPLILIVAAVVVLLLPVAVVAAMNDWRAESTRAQTQNVQTAAALNAWWASLGFTGTPTDPNAPGPIVAPGRTPPSPGTVTDTTPTGAPRTSAFDRVLAMFGGTTKTVAIVAGVALIGYAVLNRKGKSNG